MITEQDLQAAIAECQGVRNPTSGTCLKLAAYYTLQEKMFGQSLSPMSKMYSFSAPPQEQTDKVTYSSGTDFSEAIAGKNLDEVFAIMDELMSTLSVVNPRLYKSAMRKFGS